MGIIKIKDLIFEYIRRDEEGNVEGITKAVDDVNLDIKQGDFVAILGHNGSGKSTLAKHMNAILYPSEGSVWVDGKDTQQEENIWDIRQTAGMVFQNPDNQIIGQIVEEDVGFGPENMGVETKEIWERVNESLKAVGMYEFRKFSPNKLSGGQKQRVSIAGVIAMHPKCIVLDEPTSFLDIRHKLELLTILKQMVLDHQLTVIMSLHELDLAQKISDKVICVHGEYIEKYGAPEEIFTSEYIRKLYGITRGSYNAAFGCVEMDPPRGEPQVFVIGGNGSGIPYYRKLQRQGIPFAAGVLHTNDVDCQVAGALADQVITEKPFESISQESYDKAVELMKKCQKVICPLKDFGTVNAANRELLRLARELGILAEL